MISEKEKISYNLLNILFESNYQKLNQLYQKYNSWEKALNYVDKKNYNPQKEYQKLKIKNIKLILKQNKEYPKLLKEIPLAPFGIYILGNLDVINNNQCIAIVGTRKASQEGKIITKKFANMLSNFFNIVSGLALGIDSIAHLTTLENKKNTIAVLGSGLLEIYPKTNKNLAQKILNNNGAIISEYNIYTKPLPYRFLERNRIISGLSLGVIVIEAPEGSGALNTARFAIEQNRELWVVPGSVYNPNFYGSNKLIQYGAYLVIKPEDILKNLNIDVNQYYKNTPNLNDDEKLIYDTIKQYGQPIDIDKLIEITNLKTQRVIQVISLLIIKNIIKETENGYIII
ncbi:MAG: DNA-processing protein DprA [Patescibacteria group bacterium]|nr:DNA-processing protein DprA [Patescibacteria group bacterium]MDW8279754.1 DNA-processing protein DprA [bacterium]